MNFTDADRRAGRRAMEESLTPLVKALRRFAAGKPPANPPNTPLGAVALLTDQRKRVEKALADEEVKGARITSQAVVIRFTPPQAPDRLGDTIVVQEGKEGEAIQLLTQYGWFHQKFIIAGVMFAVQHGKEKRPFAYLIERTSEGKATLEQAWERQIQRTPRKNMS